MVPKTEETEIDTKEVIRLEMMLKFNADFRETHHEGCAAII